MSFGVRKIFSAASIVVLGGAVAMISAADKPQSYTGTVSDAMCGAKHVMAASPADCQRSCVKGGSAYALIVGDKVYTLQGKTDGLDQLANTKATVTGTAKGDTIEVQTVAAAK